MQPNQINNMLSSHELKQKADAALKEAADIGLVLEKNPKNLSGFKHIRRLNAKQAKFVAEILSHGADIYKWKQLEPTHGKLKTGKIGKYDTAEEAALALAKYLVKQKLRHVGVNVGVQKN